MHFIDLSEIVLSVKAFIIVISWRLPCVILKRSTVLVARVSHFLSAKVSPQRRLNPGFGILKKCPFPDPLNRGVPSIEVIDTKTM